MGQIMTHIALLFAINVHMQAIADGTASPLDMLQAMEVQVFRRSICCIFNSCLRYIPLVFSLIYMRNLYARSRVFTSSALAVMVFGVPPTRSWRASS